MPQFELTGRIIFEAEDIEDAFTRLAHHFSALAKGVESDLPLVGTNVKIKATDIDGPLEPVSKMTSYRGLKT